jgi:hypothetical protein
MLDIMADLSKTSLIPIFLSRLKALRTIAPGIVEFG